MVSCLDVPTLAKQCLAMTPCYPRLPPNSSRRVEILAYPAVQLLDVAGPLQVFATANDIAAGPLPYDPVVVAKQPQGVTSSAGLTLTAEGLSDPAMPADTLLVAGGYGVNAATADSALVGWLRRKSEASRRTASVCSGAFLLAEAGLLDGRRVVTHWQRCAELARRHPTVRVEPDPIFIRDGTVWTSAGVTAGIDLALALVEDDLGRATALAVARQLVVFLKRPGGQSQYSTALALQTCDGMFEHLHAWVVDHLADDLSTATLARVAGMSERSFLRHYRERTGKTPARVVDTLRVEAARRLLTETRTPLKRIALLCGFGSDETMRRAFARRIQTSPQAYRDGFGSTRISEGRASNGRGSALETDTLSAECDIA